MASYAQVCEYMLDGLTKNYSIKKTGSYDTANFAQVTNGKPPS